VRARAVRLVLALAAIGAGACGGDDGASVDAAAAPRTVDATAIVAGNGRSAPVMFDVPPGTRSIAISATGAPTSLYALAELALADGVDLVQLPDGNPGPAMAASYRDELIGAMPGGLYQSIRLGQFLHVYPYRPDQTVPVGPARLRIASDASGEVAVRIIMTADDGGTDLTLNVIVVSDTLAVDAPGLVGEVAAYLADAGIATHLGQTLRLEGTALANITDFNEPQETPASQSAQLPALVRDRLGTDPGLDVFVVESLPASIAGLSLGTPGPAERATSYYYGVVIKPTASGAVSGRVVAHEVAHFLGLQHVQNTGTSGATYPDPLDDTTVGEDNLMALGTTLTADQAAVLRRSPLLRLR
jgi:hypothetical protein